MLEEFLDAKPLYYDTIDYARMPRIYKKIQQYLKLPKIIHIIGTNGKGTTGRFLASALYSLGFSTGHYTSPHILRFNERLWLNGNDVDAKNVEKKHQELLALLDPSDAESLSYFEYTTLLAIMLYQDVDYLVFEAGLGGEHDATAVFQNILTLVTPIALDHEAFLGDSITSIARTKLNAIQKEAIFGVQVYAEVQSVAKELEDEKGISPRSYESYLTKEDYKKIEQIAKEHGLATYLRENLSLSIAALKQLGIVYEAENFKQAQLFGRLTQLSANIIVDVGHNTLAAKRLLESLKSFKYILVYNSYKDKNYDEILSILAPIIKRVEIIDVDDARVESRAKIAQSLERLGLEYGTFQEIDEHKEYLVFGSFSVVEAFLKVYSE